jgi:hypothetical protein
VNTAATTDANHDQGAQAIRLWPFDAYVALAAVPVLWIILGAFFWAGHRWMDWPTVAAAGGLVYIAAAIGLVPVALLVLDTIAQRRGALTTKWFSVDFGATVDEVPRRPAVEIPTSLGLPGQAVNDSSVVHVHETLAAARSNDVVRLDLGAGENWWMTRLFALCAGATEAGAPEILVFVGQDAGIDQAFLGWTRPRDAFRLMRASREPLRLIFDRANSIGRYLTTVAPGPLPAPPPPIPATQPQLANTLAAALAAVPMNYAQDARFQGLGEETTLRVLLDLLGKYEQFQQPLGGERVTPGVLQDVLGTELRREQIDTRWPRERQLSEFLASTNDYVALVDARRFQSIVHRRALENAILRQLVVPEEDTSG